MAAEKKPAAQQQLFKDPVLGQLAFAPLLFKIINTRQFQRLRDIKQLGPVYYVYPGAAHNRFEHSIGVCHLARQLLKNLRREQGELFKEYKIEEKDEMCVLIAALCHELGQGPMSHLYQDLFINMHNGEEKWKHLDTGIQMFDFLVEENLDKLRSNFEDMKIEYHPNSADMMFIKELMYGGILPNEKELKGRPRKEHWFLYEIVSNSESGIDVDKMDYIIRDCHGLGIQHGFDWQRYMRLCWLIKTEDGRVHICSREKQAADFYELYHVRDKLMREAYQHKTKRAIEYMMSEALVEADEHIELPGNNGSKVKISGAIDDVHAFTHLTDGVFWYIKFSREQGLEKAREILKKVDRRELYKCIGRSIPNPEKPKMPQEQIPGVLIELLNITQNEVDENDLLVDIVTFNYGKGTKNPIDQVWFYRKPEPTGAVKVHRHQVSEMLPKTFEEFEMRLYVKKQVTDEMRERLFSAFDEFCKRNGFQTPAGAIDPGTEPSNDQTVTYQ